MARKINIRLFNGYAIEADGATELKGSSDMLHPFGLFDEKDGKVEGIFDYHISDEHFTFLDNNPLLFNEVCEFIVWDMDKQIDSFVGSFRVAFEYLKDRNY